MSNGEAVLGKTSINTELKEKGIDISNYELNPAYVRLAPLTDEQMVRAMGGTLRHAASSIFVTSFTTAAAFLTNYITKLPYVQLFGVFTGMYILIYFSMVITMVAAFVIYEKNFQRFRCKVLQTQRQARVALPADHGLRVTAQLSHHLCPRLSFVFGSFSFVCFWCWACPIYPPCVTHAQVAQQLALPVFQRWQLIREVRDQ